MTMQTRYGMPTRGLPYSWSSFHLSSRHAASSATVPLSSLLFVQSELAPQWGDDDHYQEHATSLGFMELSRRENWHADSQMIDVDALDSNRSDSDNENENGAPAVDGEEDDGREALRSEAYTLESSSSLFETATAPLSYGATESSKLSIRDAVVLSYRAPSDDYVGPHRGGEFCDDGMGLVPQGELLAIAAEDGRVFLRRSVGACFHHGGRRRGGDGDQSIRPSPKVHVWASSAAEASPERNSSGEPEDDRCEKGAQSQGAFLTWQDKSVRPPSFSSIGAASSVSAPPLTRWKQEANVMVDHAHGTVHRIRPRGGALATFAFASSSGPSPGEGGENRRHAGGHSGCRADFVALSTNMLSLIQSRDYGAELVVVQHAVLEDDVRVNATCMDDWGMSSTLVGFSDGTLRVVDWRTPSGNVDGGAQRSVLRTTVPQPPWLMKKSRGGLFAESVAGVLCCCSFDDNFRVVCGLGDASGAVVVADLRRPDALVSKKRPRSRTPAILMTEQQLLYPEVGGRSPTGRAIADIRRDPACFGRLGLVDVAGSTAITYVGVLEGTSPSGMAAPSRTKRENDVYGAGTSSSITAPAARSRMPAPPSPWSIAERLSSATPPMFRSTLLTAILQQVRVSNIGSTDSIILDITWDLSTISTPQHPRCVFSDDGRYLIHTAPRGATAATVRRTQRTGRISSSGAPVSLDATCLKLEGHSEGGRGMTSVPFVAVSTADGVTCLDTKDGHTLVLRID